MVVKVVSAAAAGLLALLVGLRCLASFGVPDCKFRRLFAAPQGGADGAAPDGTVLRRIFLGALGIRLALFAAMVVCVLLQSETEMDFPACMRAMNRWDAGHYIQLVEQGYAGYMEDGQHLFLVFVPAYVWVVRLVRLLVPDTAAAGMLVSTLCYAWGCCWVYRLAAARFGGRVAADAVRLLSLYPFSFFFGTVMTEGLFLLTSSAACCCAIQRRWLPYAVWGFLAALTRMVGVLVILPAVAVLFEALQPFRPPLGGALKKAVRPFLRRLPALLVPLLGTAVYLLLNWYVDGDFFAFVGHQTHWYQGFLPLPEVLDYIAQNFLQNASASIGWAVWLPELVLFFVFGSVLFFAVRDRRHSTGLLLYAFAYLAANYSLSWLLSAGRYLACAFPFFLFGAVLLEKRPALRSSVFLLEGVFLGVYLFAYAAGAQIM